MDVGNQLSYRLGLLFRRISLIRPHLLMRIRRTRAGGCCQICLDATV